MRVAYWIMTIGIIGAGAAACSSSPHGSMGNDPGNAQEPPTTGASAIEAWLTAGSYRAWHCEPAAHDARSPSPHMRNRICSNDLASGAGAGEYPVGAASVKEIFDDGGNIIGYAAARHVRAGRGEAWYWYERIQDHLYGDGLGDSGGPRDICVSCHQAAGSDAGHSGHDFVYTQVH